MFTESLEPLPSANVHGGRIKRYSVTNYPTLKWPNAIAYYKIDPSLGKISFFIHLEIEVFLRLFFVEKFETEILRAIRHIQETTCITFVSRTDEPNYMSMKLVETGGCIASNGFQNSGPQDILIYEPDCGFYSYFLHQLIQSLGAIHEHQRWDRDEYITVDVQDLPGKSSYNYHKFIGGKSALL